MLYTIIGQSILPETAFPAGIDVATPITKCFINIRRSILLKTAFPAEIDVDTPIHSAEVDVDTPILIWLPRWWFRIRTLLPPLIPSPIQPIYTVKTIDIGLPTSSPFRVNFMPSSLLLAPNSVQP